VLVGKWVTPNEVLEVVIKDKVFYDASNGGVTLSGGEPLLQPDFAYAILKLCKDSKIHTAIETSGYAEWSILKKVLEYSDLVLYDIKHMDPTLHKEYTRVTNELILTNLRRICYEMKVPVWARVPIIPGCNDSFENLERMAQFLAELPGESITQVNLLPYHNLWTGKLSLLERPIPSVISSIRPPSEEDLLRIKKIFESRGLKTYIGG